jgi:hypothetical protein
LLWDSRETNAPADGEDRSAEVREPTIPRQAETVVEPILQEATLVEGKWFSPLVVITDNRSSH